jgi:hypothetical protein
MTLGIPTGSPIQQPLANLYLTPLDESLQAREGFYARFGDDLLVATSTLDDALAFDRDLGHVVGGLELRFNPEKTKNLYFTKPGRPLATDAPFSVTPTSHVEYLGVRMNFDGGLGLSKKRTRQLLQRSRWRIDNSVGIAPAERALETVAQCLNRALTSDGPVADSSAEALRTWVDDRDQLRQLDRLLAQRCAEALSGKRGVRAFRHVRMSALRAAGLASLLEIRRRRRQP